MTTLVVLLLDALRVDRACEDHPGRTRRLWPLCATCRSYHHAGREAGFWR